MTTGNQKKLARELSALGVFRGILHTAAMTSFIDFLGIDGDAEPLKKASRYGDFVYALADDGYCFSDFLCRAVFSDKNLYVVSAARGDEIPACLFENAARELSLFSSLTLLDSDALCAPLGNDCYLPRFENRETDFVKAYAKRLANVGKYGYGIFASSTMFRISGDEILPVKSADAISLDDFIGYEEERRRVFENTVALCDGRPAANVLLCGDAGTGKSSTVKACANALADRGVRLIELRKDQLLNLSHIMGRIADNPLKFIIFIDDLSFNKNDDCFSMLKAALEGSASAKAKNAVIYATSNRRHIIKESFSDREGGDDVHRNDTVQELMSLSDRFGLTVYFEKPNKALYLEIVHRLAERYGIFTDQKELDARAEAFALGRGSRSPRAAEQFINSLM